MASSGTGTTVSAGTGSLAMTGEEERELTEQLGSDVVVDFDAVYGRLSSNLFSLETSSVQGLMGTRSDVSDILSVEARVAESQLEEMDVWLRKYEIPLRDVRQYIEKIEGTNNRMEVLTKNQRSLLAALQDLLSRLRLDSVREPLQAADLGDPASVVRLAQCAEVLRGVLEIAVSPELADMVAVREQLEGARRLQGEFSRRLVRHLCESFSKLDARISKDKRTGDAPALANVADPVRGVLEPYAPLATWLKEVDPGAQRAVLGAYVQTFSRTTHRRVKDFFAEVRGGIARETKGRRDRLAAVLFGPNAKKTDEDWLKVARSRPPKEGVFSADRAFTLGLSESAAAVKAEHDWGVRFFGLSSKRSPEKPDEPCENETMLLELFGDLRGELSSVVEVAFKADPFHLLTALVETDRYTEDESCLFLQHEAHAVQQTCKQIFSTFVDEQVAQIASSQATLRRCGVLPHFSRFPYFVDYMEEAGTGRTAELESEATTAKREWTALASVSEFTYAKLVNGLFGWLDSMTSGVASAGAAAVCASGVTGRSKVVARLENFRHFRDSLSERRVPCLQQYVQQANDTYKQSLATLCEATLPKLFGSSLLEFFGQIDMLISAHKMPPEEVQFQAAFSKQACLSVISKAAPAALEKGCEVSRRAFEDELSTDNVKLLEDVWQAFEATALSRYSHIFQLVKACYPGSKLSVSPDDLKAVIGAAGKSGDRRHRRHHRHHKDRSGRSKEDEATDTQ